MNGCKPVHELARVLPPLHLKCHQVMRRLVAPTQHHDLILPLIPTLMLPARSVPRGYAKQPVHRRRPPLLLRRARVQRINRAWHL